MDLFKLVGKISVEYSDAVNNIEKVSKSAKGTADGLKDVDKKADEAGRSIQDSGESAKKADGNFTIWKATLANLASKAITKVVGGCKDLAQKIIELGKTTVGYFADNEQLVGGVETLFKDSSDKLIGYAKKAYKTAGMSSNQYMDTATSFAASLIQGLGGDTAKAVELTNLAITDMSDNANKMGTNIGDIQNAYQGFAKQNYTMLDNLKLGYGGTQSEMIRLINDSGVLGEKIEGLDNVTFDQMIEAIHKIQDNLGITGTTALEAGTTISGSWSSVQALFENILTKVGSKLAPTVMSFLQQLSDWMESVDWDAFSEKVGNALQKVFDWVQKIDFTTFFEEGMDGVEKFLGKLGELIEKVPEAVKTFKDLLPVITGAWVGFKTLKAGMAISKTIDTLTRSWRLYKKANEEATVAQWLLNDAQLASPAVIIIAVIAALVAAIVTLYLTNEDFRKKVSEIWDAVKEKIGAVIEGIKQFFTDLADKARQVLEDIHSTVSEKLTAISEFVSSAWETIKNVVEVGLMFIEELINAAFQLITLPFQLIWQNCGNEIVAAWGKMKTTVSDGLAKIKDAIVSSPIVKVVTEVWDKVTSATSTAWTKVKNLVSEKINAAKEKVSAVTSTIRSSLSEAWNRVTSATSEAYEKVRSIVSDKMSVTKEKVSGVLSEIRSTFKDKLSAAKNTVSDIFGKITSAIGGKMSSARQKVSDAIERIRSKFRFSWSLPHLKLPHISISGSFSLTPPSVPHFSIDWYKKAMDDGMIMNQPTIFGYNAKSNQFMAGGEAGSETVVGTQSLMTMIKTAVNEENASLLERLDRVVRILESYMPFIPQLANLKLVTDTGVLAGELAPAMDEELGKIFDREGRR